MNIEEIKERFKIAKNESLAIESRYVFEAVNLSLFDIPDLLFELELSQQMYFKLSADNVKVQAELERVSKERDAAYERLCYSCNNYNLVSEIKHSKSCDICPWKHPHA